MSRSTGWSKAQLVIPKIRRLSQRHATRSLISRTLSGDKPGLSTAYQGLTVFLLVASLALVVADSIEPWATAHARLLTACDGVLSGLTLLDYLARLATCTERAVYRDLGPVHGRLRFMRSWGAMVDLAASVPFFVDILTIVELPPLTWLRIFRIASVERPPNRAAALPACTWLTPSRVDCSARAGVCFARATMRRQ
jgi:hypothetical protein